MWHLVGNPCRVDRKLALVSPRSLLHIIIVGMETVDYTYTVKVYMLQYYYTQMQCIMPQRSAIV